ncbi:MAG: alpha-ketoacid dehydrogenase subunit beta [Firmicutes bacterium]|jgi:pyruvate dehydrogenase E1 component beta subunit|nr:alpha-ketoacid dehydrogenase subunit beta [Bacillota bacterium]
MRNITYRQAINEALKEEMTRDPRVVLLGEDVGPYGGNFKVTDGLWAEFGDERVMDTPISENGICGVGLGLAVNGFRPVIEVMFSDFTANAMDQLVNQVAKLRYMSGGQLEVPMVVRTTIGGGRSSAAQHSQSLHAWFWHVPGFRVVLPSSPYDAKGLLKAAIRSNDPVMFFEHKMEYNFAGPVPEEDYVIELGKADVKREGRDVTVICTSFLVQKALAAAEKLAPQGIDIEVVDPRSLNPLDRETLEASVRKTGRVVIADEGHITCGAGAELAAILGHSCFDYLDSPIERVGTKDVPIPFSPPMEQFVVPGEESIIKAVMRTLGK